ncbi:uncharacterized protein TNCV_3061521 [Trichonephila clavipes]|nr:uncharacterized protein TNCV_3061521 [Trichonephila clavipes]
MGRLIGLDMTLTDDRYAIILSDHTHSFMPFVHSDGLQEFQQDNETSYTYRIATKCSRSTLLNLGTSTRHQIPHRSILERVSLVAEENMLRAAKEVRELKHDKNKFISCGVSVDGMWQRRGYSSLNGCATAISIDTGKVLHTEILSSYCRICNVTKPNIS